MSLTPVVWIRTLWAAHRTRKSSLLVDSSPISSIRCLSCGFRPARAYIETLMPGILSGTVNPGRVFDREVTLDQTPGGYEDMDSRRALKVLIRG